MQTDAGGPGTDFDICKGSRKHLTFTEREGVDSDGPGEKLTHLWSHLSRPKQHALSLLEEGLLIEGRTQSTHLSYFCRSAPSSKTPGYRGD